MPESEPTQLQHDLACVECGYNLRGLDADGECPECGVPVRSSVAVEIGRWSKEAIARVDHALDWLGGSGDRLTIACILTFLMALLYSSVIYLFFSHVETGPELPVVIIGMPAFILLILIWPWKRTKMCAALRRYPQRHARRYDAFLGPGLAFVPNIAIPLFILIQAITDGIRFNSYTSRASLTVTLVCIAIVIAWLLHLHWLRTVFADLFSHCERATGTQRTYIQAGLRGLRRGMVGTLWFLIIVDFGFCFAVSFSVNAGNGRPVLWLIAMPIAHLTHARQADELRKFLKLEREAAKTQMGVASSPQQSSKE